MHSIIIPYRPHPQRKLRTSLAQTLWSIDRSARLTDRPDYEQLVITDGDGNLGSLPGRHPHLRVIRLLHSTGPLCKPRLQNVGIREARGEVLSFLDADVLVGPRWMEGEDVFCVLADGDYVVPTRLCYRVRRLREGVLDDLQRSKAPNLIHNGWLLRYADLPRAHEGYGRAETNAKEGMEPLPFGPHVFGNSQFTILRQVLGGIRFDEEYVGRQWEDLSTLRQIAATYAGDYLGLIFTDADRALLHIDHPGGCNDSDPWNNQTLIDANKARYFGLPEGNSVEAMDARVEAKCGGKPS